MPESILNFDVNQFLREPGGQDNIWLLLLLVGVGSVVLTSYVNNRGHLAGVINFSVLFCSAMASNRLLGKLHLPVDQELVEPLIMYLVGITIGSLLAIRFMNDNQ